MISLQSKDSEVPTVEKRAILNWAATKTRLSGREKYSVDNSLDLKETVGNLTWPQMKIE